MDQEVWCCHRLVCAPYVLTSLTEFPFSAPGSLVLLAQSHGLHQCVHDNRKRCESPSCSMTPPPSTTRIASRSIGARHTVPTVFEQDCRTVLPKLGSRKQACLEDEANPVLAVRQLVAMAPEQDIPPALNRCSHSGHVGLDSEYLGDNSDASCFEDCAATQPRQKQVMLPGEKSTGRMDRQHEHHLEDLGCEHVSVFPCRCVRGHWRVLTSWQIRLSRLLALGGIPRQRREVTVRQRRTTLHDMPKYSTFRPGRRRSLPSSTLLFTIFRREVRFTSACCQLCRFSAGGVCSCLS